MEVTELNKTRRSFLYALGTGIIAIPLSTLTREGSALAATAPKLELEDPTAKVLEYVHESPDATKLCVGCQLYTGAAGDEWGPCARFPGKVVSGKG